MTEKSHLTSRKTPDQIILPLSHGKAVVPLSKEVETEAEMVRRVLTINNHVESWSSESYPVYDSSSIRHVITMRVR